MSAGLRATALPQRRRKYVLALGIGLCVLLLTVTASSWRTWPRVHEKRELVRKGPYSIVRNPLYISSVVGAVGVGAQSGSIANTVIFGAASLLIFYFVVLEEERFLAAAFPDAFAAYAAQVPRFWPRLSLWEDAGELLVTPRLVHWTFLDASLFLLALPVTSLIHGGSTWVGYRCCSTCPKRSLTWLRRGETNVGSADRNDRLP